MIVTATELKNNLGKYLELVLHDDSIIITKNGEPIAKICPVTDYEDAIAVEVARRHDGKAIITRNIKDFSGPVIPAILPQEFDPSKTTK